MILDLGIKPYYSTEYGDLYNADCLEILPKIPDGSINLVITDPPYGMNYQSNHRKQKHLKIQNDNSTDLMNSFIDWCLKNVNGASYLFTRWDFLNNFPKPKSLITWVKNNWSMGDLEHEHARQTEVCLFYAGKNHKFLNTRPTDVIFNDRTNNELHPTEKPVNLIKKMLNWHDGLVLDAFSGSGTTAVACEDLKRRWICIEKEEKYCEITAQRIYNLDRNLF